MIDQTTSQTEDRPQSARPWQFSLLHLFGLTTLVCICAAAFYWNPSLGLLVFSFAFLAVATFYRTHAVIQTAAPSLRERSYFSLLRFGVVTSLVANFAALVAFVFGASLVGSFAIGSSSPATVLPILGLAFVVGSALATVVLWRNWPRPAQRLKPSGEWSRPPDFDPQT